MIILDIQDNQLENCYSILYIAFIYIYIIYFTKIDLITIVINT